ncbi:sugar-binding transcriptional regulator [Vibrio sp. SS-MA-C1-2]|uniref:sugar-binding transcriptional regulator n=1 Tax=Vibrio sp. SS-MA-C1-2 TaxID=2908646 RepID=UPI001F3D9EC0|nr:sugar-binding transcriptional regulator [Vibrio sp. SS-MA-C1-2]UJF18485.1 sugar-binding transcriptional regulator [Vibrio sp. SS-MA-C1-2]
MNKKNSNSIDEQEMLTELSIDYYYKKITQEEIAKKFNISRIRVGRLLKKARDIGIVNITVQHHPVYSGDIEQRLKERFNISRALISVDHQDEVTQRNEVATLIASYLSERIEDDLTIAVGQGRNIAAIANSVGYNTDKNCHFICSIGGIHEKGEQSNSDHICRQLSKKYGGTSESMYAPAYVKTKELKDKIMDIDTVNATICRARASDIALIGVGNMDEQSFMVDLGWFSKQEVVNARINHGVVGDIAGYDFFDINGNAVITPINDRIIGLSIDDYHQIPEVIAIASENNKSLALLGALRTGVIDVLATSMSNALSILSIDKQKTY